MSDTAPVAVIIPVYNRSQWIVRSVGSVLRQSLLPAEVVVVGDGCSDDSLDQVRQLFAKADPRIQTKILSQPNSGVSSARNLGIYCTNAPWLAFLDSDDEWLEDKLKIQWDYINAHPQFKIVHNDEIWIRHGKRVNAKRKHQKSGGRIFRSCLPLCCISPSCAIIHREIFHAVGVFDSRYTVCEDYHLWLRICAKFPVGYIEQKLIRKYGGHADQLSQRYFAMDQYRISALAEISQSSALSDEERLDLWQTMRHKASVLALGANKHQNHLLQWQLRKMTETWPAQYPN